MDTKIQLQTIETSPQAYAAAVDELASELHEQERKTRLNSESGFEPDIKTTNDEAWINEHGTNQVDIANTQFPDLPSDWQVENKVAAEVIVDIIDGNRGKINLLDENKRNEIGEEIHNAWLLRNEWAKGGNLDVPFSELPKDEQDKDINQMIVAQRVFSN